MPQPTAAEFIASALSALDEAARVERGDFTRLTHDALVDKAQALALLAVAEELRDLRLVLTPERSACAPREVVRGPGSVGLCISFCAHCRKPADVTAAGECPACGLLLVGSGSTREG